MWKVLKIKKRELGLFKRDFLMKFGSELKIYSPKVMIVKNMKNKLIKKEIDILGDYLFCYHKCFKKKEFSFILKNLKGLKYILTEDGKNQNEIIDFINKCKNAEDKNGFLTQKFFDLNIKKTCRFLNGPFAEKIFEIINLQKNKIDILLGNLKVNIDKSKFIYNSI